MQSQASRPRPPATIARRGGLPSRGAAAPLVAVLGLLGCTSTTTVIDGDDSTFLGSGRVSLPMDNGDTVLELDLGLASGGFDQVLGVGDSVELEDVTFTGPGTVAVDFDLMRAYVAARRTFIEENGLGIAVLVGGGMTRLDASAAMGGAKDTLTDSALGLLVGLEPFYRFSERTKVYGEVTLLTGLSSSYDTVDLTGIDLGFAYAPFAHVELAAGWRSWRYEAEAGFESDLDLTLRGPHVSLRVTP